VGLVLREVLIFLPTLTSVERIWLHYQESGFPKLSESAECLYNGASRSSKSPIVRPVRLEMTTLREVGHVAVIRIIAYPFYRRLRKLMRAFFYRLSTDTIF